MRKALSVGEVVSRTGGRLGRKKKFVKGAEGVVATVGKCYGIKPQDRDLNI